MASELIFIVGPTLSGKTLVANAFMAMWQNTVKVYDEPIFSRKFLKEIKLFRAYNGRVIITMCDDSSEYIAILKPDRIITCFAP